MNLLARARGGRPMPPDVANGVGTGAPRTGRHAAALPAVVLAGVIVMATGLALGLHAHSFLHNARLGPALVSEGLYNALRRSAAGELALGRVIGLAELAALAAWIGGGLAARAAGAAWPDALARWGLRFLWLGAPVTVFELLWTVGGFFSQVGQDSWIARVAELLPFFSTVAIAGFLASTARLVLAHPALAGVRRVLGHPALVWCAVACYAITFSTLSILQYRALLVPHGDTAMYEEHLWNVLHGKGFRSQLDDGRLFLGEHLEVIHLVLLPIYVLAPCLPTLNICLSAALASGAIAVRAIARRLTGSGGLANALAFAYLLYFPLQYLNLEASLKTFRPENLAVPLVLFALWCLETDRVRTMLVLLGLALLAKEDYAIPLAALGVYLALGRADRPSRRGDRLLGLGLFVFGVAYLAFVLGVFIPYFRQGPPHYTAYFAELGRTPLEILLNLLAHPSKLTDRLATFDNLLFVLMMLVPLGGVPLADVRRIAVLVPSLVSILVSQLDATHSPMFHFHAPLVPVLFWAAAGGMARIARRRGLVGGSADAAREGLAAETPPEPRDDARTASPGPTPLDGADRTGAAAPLSTRCAGLGLFVVACALVSGFWFGKSPLALAFYDPHMDIRGFGRALYAPTGLGLERVRRFEQVLAGIPDTASVAATDFVRPRFTHYRACHQYGENGLKSHVPPDSIDYIVVDLFGPYSNWLEGRRIREVEEHPEHWEVAYDDPFFLVVRARHDR